MKILPALVMVCVGIYISVNHPDVASVMYGYFMQTINFVLKFFGKSL